MGDAKVSSKFDDMILPQGIDNRSGMDRLLTVLAEEFPHYHTDVGQMAQAGLAIGTMMGSVGAWVMFRSKSPEQSLDKFARLVTTAGMDMAGKGYPLIKARVASHGFQQSKWEPGKQ
jgi:hypothetical protein